MVGWHYQINGHEFEQTLGDDDGRGSLACCSPWGQRVRHNLATEEPPPRNGRQSHRRLSGGDSCLLLLETGV